jgi:general stress protein 26
MLDQTRLRRAVDKAFAKKSFMTLATSSSADRSHAAGVIYAAVDGILYVGTNMRSRKVRNIEANANVAVCIPVRRLPVGPPATLMFQGTAEALGRDDRALRALLDSGRLKRLTSHGELDDPDNWFIKITPKGKVHTFGLGVPLRALIRHPLETMGSLELS